VLLVGFLLCFLFSVCKHLILWQMAKLNHLGWFVSLMRTTDLAIELLIAVLMKDQMNSVLFDDSIYISRKICLLYTGCQVKIGEMYSMIPTSSSALPVYDSEKCRGYGPIKMWNLILSQSLPQSKQPDHLALWYLYWLDPQIGTICILISSVTPNNLFPLSSMFKISDQTYF